MPLRQMPSCLTILSAAVCAVWLNSAAAASTVGGKLAAPAQSAEAGIAWIHASSDADVDAAFAQAKAEGKPLFLYWGAKWCPPCNHVKATLFNRQDFIARSRAFVPVYIDGDSPGAQKLGARFKARGYPTMVLFKADGSELTRLPGEVDARQYTEVLTLGMNAQRPVKQVLADARRSGAKLSAADWRMLAFHSWDTDEQQTIPKADVPALLAQLAADCPPKLAETASRLLLQSLAASDGKAAVDPATRQRVLRLLADPAQARAQMDVLGNRAPALVKALSAAATPERRQLLGRFDTTLKILAHDASLSRADRMTAQLARVELARIDEDTGTRNVAPVLPAALLTELRDQVARDDREISNPYERQAVITTGAYVLTRAGLVEASDTLLRANLVRSHSPYYLMSALASNARTRGDHAEALRWYEQAYARSEGPATRLQWGASYLVALVDLAPQDVARIEAAAQQVFKDAAGQPNAFYERSARSLQRIASKLQVWAGGSAGGATASAALQRLQLQLDDICRQLPTADAQRGACDKLLKPSADAKAA